MEIRQFTYKEKEYEPTVRKIYDDHYGKYCSTTGIEDFDREMELGRSQILMILEGDQLIGIAKWTASFEDQELSRGWLSGEKDFSLLDMLEILPKYQGKGYGKMFMELLEILAKSMGVRIIAVGATIDNERAISFYRKCCYIGKAGYFDEDGENYIFSKRI